MFIERLNVAVLFCLISTIFATSYPGLKTEDIIERDVVVLGGGAAGTYAAIRLRDQNKTVIVIEKQNHLGGHVDTFSVPGSPFGLDYGVIAYLELPGIRQFFARFGLSLFSAPNPGFDTRYADFSTGQAITPAASTYTQVEVQTALGRYGQLAAQYANYTFPSLIQLPVGEAIPNDLILSFGEFVQKYNLQAAVPTIWGFVNYAGDVLNETTAYIISQYGAVHLNATASGGLLLTSALNNSVLYDRARTYLGSDVLLESTVIQSKRTSASVELIVDTKEGKKLLKAKTLLVTIPPLVTTLRPLSLDSIETGVFSRWIYQSAYVGVLNNTGLPNSLDLVNAVADSSPDVLNLAGTNGKSYVWNFIYSALFPGVFRTNIIGTPDLSAAGAKNLVSKSLAQLRASGLYNTTEPDWLAFSSHKPLQLRAKIKDILEGFYQQAFALNGHRSTYYAGAAWASDYTTIHWTYLETVILPLILKS